MISTDELLEWKEKILKTDKNALYKAEKAKNTEVSAYYLSISQVANNQLALINRLIEQSRENEKEQICQK